MKREFARIRRPVAKSLALLGMTIVANAQSPASKSPVDQLIPWLLDEDRQLRGIAFSEVIFDTTGKRVLPIDMKNEVDTRLIKLIGGATDETLRRVNAPDSAVQSIGRINEVSSHFEDLLRELLNATPGLNCDFPRTADGKTQRSGYPDLRTVDLASKRVFYLDPKLYAVGSRGSSFRTFYFEPKSATNKVRDDAVHLIAGFEHEQRAKGIGDYALGPCRSCAVQSEIEGRVSGEQSRHVSAGGDRGHEREVN